MFTSPVAEHRGEVRQRPRPVRYLDLQHRHSRPHRRLRRQSQPRTLGFGERGFDVGPPLPHDLVAQSDESLGVEVDRFGDRPTVREQDVAPQRGVRSCEPGEIAEPAGGEQQDVGLVGFLAWPPGSSERWTRPAAGGSRRPRAGRVGPGPCEPDVPRGESTHASRVSTAAGSLASCGVIAHTMPSTTDADACSGPDRSLPPMGGRARTGRHQPMRIRAIDVAGRARSSRCRRR